MQHFTCEGFELVLQIKRLSAQGCQIHLQSRAYGKLLDGPADLKDLVRDSLLGRTWRQQKTSDIARDICIKCTIEPQLHKFSILVIVFGLFGMFIGKTMQIF